MSDSIVAIARRLALPYLEQAGYELYDIAFVKEGGNRILRLIVDKPGGITIDDCSLISEYVSARLDEEDPIEGAYFLEVTSPGAERPLRNADDFRKAVGRNVYITTREAVQGRNVFEGVLKSFSESELEIQSGKKVFTIPTDLVAGARLAVVL